MDCEVTNLATKSKNSINKNLMNPNFDPHGNFWLGVVIAFFVIFTFTYNKILKDTIKISKIREGFQLLRIFVQN